MVARVTIQSYARGKTVFSQGDPGDAFFVVVDGWVKLSRFTTNGDEAVFSVIARGESFAEPIMFMGGRYPVNAIAATDCRLARMEHDRRLSVLSKASAIWRRRCSPRCKVDRGADGRDRTPEGLGCAKSCCGIPASVLDGPNVPRRCRYLSRRH